MATRVLQPLFAPIAWLSRAWRRSGPERAAVIQTAKAALAAVVAWIAAVRLFDLSQPFLAPYAAVFIIESTVYRSVRSSAQQVSAVGAGVLLAWTAARLIPAQVVALGVAVFLGMLIGQWRRFGDNGPWVGITALLMLTLGGAGQEALLVDRLIEVAMGAAIGTAVNAVLFPPLYAAGARQAVEHLAGEFGGLLDDIAHSLRHEQRPDNAEDWVARIRQAGDLITEAEQAVDWSRESRRLNMRRRTGRTKLPDDLYSAPLLTLRAVGPYIQAIAEAVRTTSQDEYAFTYPDHGSRQRFAALLDAIAEVIRLRIDRSVSMDELEDALADSRRKLDELDDRLVTSPLETIAPAGLGSMLAPARHALRELSAV